MNPSARRAQWVTLVAAFAAVVLGALWFLHPPAAAERNGLDLVAMVVAGMLGERLSLPRQHGRAPTLSVAVIGTAALMGWSPIVAIEIAAVAWLAQARTARLAGQEVGAPRLGQLASRVLAAWGLTGVIGLAASLDPTGWTIHYQQATPTGWELPVASVTLLWFLIVLGLPLAEAAELRLRADRARRLRYRDLLRAGWQGESVLAASATLGALAYPILHWPTVLLMALPLLAAKVGLDRYTDIRRTYDQTLRAMSRLPEQLGAVAPGHGVRVGEMAARAAVELGYPAAVVADVERAAQLHELGRIKTERGLDLSVEEAATSGAAVIREAGELDRVADLISAHRGHATVGDEIAWVGGALLRLACDLDLRLQARGSTVLSEGDRAWLSEQGVEPRVARALLRSARSLSVPA